MRQSNGKMYVAVTGGIGSGKSTVIKMIGERGFHVYSADEAARNIYDDPLVKAKVRTVFPECFSGDVPDRKKLAEEMFADRNKLEQLNGITHPAIMEKLFVRAESDSDRVIFFEIPLLFESGYEGRFDKVIVVMRDKSLRINSVMRRDGLSEEQVKARIANQIDYEKIQKNAHTIIYNNGDLPSLRNRVNGILDEIFKGK